MITEDRKIIVFMKLPFCPSALMLIYAFIPTPPSVTPPTLQEVEGVVKEELPDDDQDDAVYLSDSESLPPHHQHHRGGVGSQQLHFMEELLGGVGHSDHGVRGVVTVILKYLD